MVRSSAAGYDVPVAGLDEASARSVLAAMQDRLTRDPSAALGIGANATADDVRAAFLQLTKQYHPVRFGRMALDIQRLSNEVFLALRAAHDALVKAARRPSLPPASLPATTQATGAAPPNARAPQLLPARQARTSSASSSGSFGSSGSSGETTGERPPVAVSRTVTPSTSLKPPARALSPSETTGERPPVAVPRTVTPSSGVKPPASRPPGQVPGQVPGARSSSSVRQSGGQLALSSRDEAVAIDLLQRMQWDQARTVLHQLLARDPNSKRIRALMSYARGREAQLERRVDDARVELQQALDLDPDLQLAKTALTELFTRRK